METNFIPAANDAWCEAVATGDGQTDFNFDFWIERGADLSVKVYRGGAEVADLLFDGDFSLVGTPGANGGAIRLSGVSILDGDVIRMIRVTDIRRSTLYQDDADFYAADANGEASRLFAIAQEQDRDLGRSIKSALGAPAPEFPLPVAGRVLGFGDDLSLITVPNDAAAVAADVAAAAASAATAEGHATAAAASETAAAASATDAATDRAYIDLAVSPFVRSLKPLTGDNVSAKIDHVSGNYVLPGKVSGLLSDAATLTRASSGYRFGAGGYMESVAANVPRFSFDLVTGRRLGLDIDPAVTNLVPDPLPGGITTRDNLDAVPGSPGVLGAASATRVEAIGSGLHRLKFTQDLVAGQRVNVSLICRADTTEFIRVDWSNGAFGTNDDTVFAVASGGMPVQNTQALYEPNTYRFLTPDHVLITASAIVENTTPGAIIGVLIQRDQTVFNYVAGSPGEAMFIEFASVTIEQTQSQLAVGSRSADAFTYSLASLGLNSKAGRVRRVASFRGKALATDVVHTQIFQDANNWIATIRTTANPDALTLKKCVGGVVTELASLDACVWSDGFVPSELAWDGDRLACWVNDTLIYDGETTLPAGLASVRMGCAPSGSADCIYPMRELLLEAGALGASLFARALNYLRSQTYLAPVNGAHPGIGQSQMVGHVYGCDGPSLPAAPVDGFVINRDPQILPLTRGVLPNNPNIQSVTPGQASTDRLPALPPLDQMHAYAYALAKLTGVRQTVGKVAYGSSPIENFISKFAPVTREAEATALAQLKAEDGINGSAFGTRPDRFSEIEALCEEMCVATGSRYVESVVIDIGTSNGFNGSAAQQTPPADLFRIGAIPGMTQDQYNDLYYTTNADRFTATRLGVLIDKIRTIPRVQSTTPFLLLGQLPGGGSSEMSVPTRRANFDGDPFTYCIDFDNLPSMPDPQEFGVNGLPRLPKEAYKFLGNFQRFSSDELHPSGYAYLLRGWYLANAFALIKAGLNS